MQLERRQIAILLAGICAFLNLYATQSLLPELQQEFHASISKTSMTLSATTLAVALFAPLAGGIADKYGRRRTLLWAVLAMGLSTLLLAMAPTLEWIIGLRFLIGLCIPGIFTSALAYIGEEWSLTEAAKVTSLYISGNVLGGFLGRFLTGFFTEHFGWKPAFLFLGLFTLLCLPAVRYWLPRPKRFIPSPSIQEALSNIRPLLLEPPLLVTDIIGFGILFSQVATFTYIGYYLAQPPFSLHPDQIGAIFTIYLIGMLITPATGHWSTRFGRHAVLLTAMIIGSLGMLLTLRHDLFLILTGLTLSSASVFASQAAATSFIPKVAKHHRSTAVGIYVSCYYLGGSAGAQLPSLLWTPLGWTGCVLMVVIIQCVIAVLGFYCWRPYEKQPMPNPGAVSDTPPESPSS